MFLTRGLGLGIEHDRHDEWHIHWIDELGAHNGIGYRQDQRQGAPRS